MSVAAGLRINMRLNHLEGRSKHTLLDPPPEFLILCISHKSLGDVDAAASATTL